jgi:trk system potassium uptake protein TrkA
MRILIAGGGQVSALIAGRLVREGNEVVIVEQDAERCRVLEEQFDAKIVRGTASSVLTLRRAGLAEAEMLIAATNVDEINLLACLIAQVESKARIKVARLRTHEFAHWRRLAEAAGLKIDLIIHPETDVADRVMRVLRVPGVSAIWNFADDRALLFGMNVEGGSWLAGKSLEDLDRAGPPRNSLVVMLFRDSR